MNAQNEDPQDLETTTSVPDTPDTEVEGVSDGEPTELEQAPVTEAPSDPFSGTRMEGRTSEDAAAYLRFLEQSIAQQSAEITRIQEQATAAPAPTPEEDELDFFQNPREVIRREMEAMIAPINREIETWRAQAGVNTAWQQMSKEIPDFDQYRPYIERMVEGRDIKPSQINTDLLRSLYYAAVGYVAKHGLPTTTATGGAMGHPERPAVRTTPPINVPQHRPSGAPLPSEPSKPKVRKLTEVERRLKREWGIESDEEFLALQEADASDVLTQEFGGKND